MVKLEVNRSRANEIVEILVTAFSKKACLFSDTKELLENQIPDGVTPLSIEHANFLFYLIPNDYGTKSATLYEKAKRLYIENPDIFCASEVLKRFNGPDDYNLVLSTGAKLGVRFPQESAKRWYFNTERLWGKYKGDARNIFISSSVAKETFNNIREFRGCGPKIGALLLRTFIGCGFARYDDIENVLMPVDVHDVRIAFRSGVVRTQGETIDRPDNQDWDYHKYARQVQRVWSDACKAKGVDWLTVDRALWILGSKSRSHVPCESCLLNLILHDNPK